MMVGWSEVEDEGGKLELGSTGEQAALCWTNGTLYFQL